MIDSLRLLFMHRNRDSKDSIAICQWHIAATSSKTGCYLNFCPSHARAKMQTSPVAVPCVRLAHGGASLHTDRCHSLRSLHLPPAALPSLPLPVYRRPPGGYNPSVSFADSPAGPAPLLSATQTFSPLTGKSTLYTREPLLLRNICALIETRTHILL